MVDWDEPERNRRRKEMVGNLIDKSLGEGVVTNGFIWKSVAVGRV